MCVCVCVFVVRLCAHTNCKTAGISLELVFNRFREVTRTGLLSFALDCLSFFCTLVRLSLNNSHLEEG